VLAEVRAAGSAEQFALRQSELHAAYFRESPLMPAEAAMFEEMAAKSLAEQAAVEQGDKVSFDDFVAAYNSSTLCGNH
jgi:glutamate--cysteine ligase